MPRLIILLLTVASLAALTLQNLSSDSEVPLVLVGQTVSEGIPLGWLLLSAVGMGTLLTLFLYGLVGLQRPAKSKYQPMGRRVPYPSNPDSSTFPTSEPGGNDVGTPANPSGYATSDYGRSSAFVSEPSAPLSPSDPPPSPRPASPPPEDTPFITPPQDTPPSASSPSASSPSASSQEAQSTTYPSTYASPDDFAGPPPRSQPGSFMQQPIDGIKSALGFKSGLGVKSGLGSGKKKNVGSLTSHPPKTLERTGANYAPQNSETDGK